MPSCDLTTQSDELAARAVALRAELGYNCAQAVACALAPEIGADAEACYVLSEGFGGGMGGHTETCGAISGGVMALGQVSSGGTALSGTTKKRTYELTRELVERFGAKNGSTICCELKGAGCEHGPLRSCPGCIEDAVKITAEVIARQSAPENAA